MPQMQYNACSWSVTTMQYNVRQQLTRITQSGKMDMEYIFHDPANNDFVNNGRVRKTKDHLSGEEVTYGYDELNRLISAATTSNDWGLAWVFDGFGNRLQQNVTKGSAPALSVTVDGTRNRITSCGFAFDDHGNMTARPGQTLSYDPAHRLAQVVDGSSGTTQFAYDSANERIWKENASSEEFHSRGVVFWRLAVRNHEFVCFDRPRLVPVRDASFVRSAFI